MGEYAAVIYYVVVVLFAAYNVANSADQRRKAKHAAEDQRAQAEAAAAAAEKAARGQLINVTSTQEPLKLIYGTVRVGINRAYIGTAGDDNNYCYVIGNVGEGEVEGIYQEAGVDQLFLDEKIYTGFGSAVSYEFFTGTSTQMPCATLHAVIPEWNEAKRHCAYSHLKFTYDTDKFQGLPDVTMIVKGLKIYDPRTGLTAWSNNGALCTLDYVTRSARRGGMGINIARLDMPSFIDAANYCDAKGWTCNLALYNNTGNDAADNLRQILDTFRGELIYSDNMFKCRYRDLNYESPVMSLTEADVVEIKESTLRIRQPSTFATPNAVRIKFTDKDINYQTNDYVLADPDAILDDGGDYREETLSIPGIDNYANAMKMANYWLERLRINKGVNHQAGGRCIRLEPVDIIQLTHSMPGWVDKLLRVENVAVDMSGVIILDYKEEDASFYDDTYNIATHNTHDTNLPDVSSVIPPTGLTIAEEIYFDASGNNILSRVDLSWQASTDAFVQEYEVEYKLASASTWNRVISTRATATKILAMEPGLHDFRVRSVNTLGVKSAWFTIQKYIFGKTAPPSDIANMWAEAAQGGLKLTWTAVSDIDLSHYKIRWSSDLVLGSWAHSLDIGISKTTTITIPAARSGVYFVKAVDTTGHESTNAISVETTIPPILGWNVQETQVQEPTWPGIITDMVVVDGVLKMDSSVSFDGIADFDAVTDMDYQAGVAALGTYETAMIDLGDVQTARCSVEIEFGIVSLDEDFDSIPDFDAVTNLNGLDNTNAGIIPQIALSQNGVDWGAWQNFVTGDYTARAFKMRLYCYCTDGRSWVEITSASFIVDMPDREEAGVDVTCPVGGLSVTYTKPFMAMPRIGVTAQGLQTGDFYALTNKTASGFDIIFKNSVGAGVERTLDWVAKGY